LAQKTFSEVFSHNGIILSSFDKWVPHAITRFILITQTGDSYPRLLIDADPLSIQYPTSSSILPTPSIPTLPTESLVKIGRLSHRNVKLVSHDASSYVLKTIERQDELDQWRNELKTLLLLRDSPHVIDLVALVDIPNPYSPNGSRVVSGFLLEYGSKGSLHDILENKQIYIEPGVKLKWILDVAEGLQNIHSKGLVHGDVKPRNIVVTSANEAKLIDFAGNGFSERYHAPEMHVIIANESPWPSSLDTYSFGFLVQEVLTKESPEEMENYLDVSQMNELILTCLSEDASRRPQFSNIVALVRELGK
jgi:serine/threonine protein kinase